MRTTDIARRRGFWGAAPTRFFILFVVLVLAYGGSQFAVLSLVSGAPSTVRPWLPIATGLALCAGLVAIYAGLVRLLERRSTPELALGSGTPLALAGLLVGTSLFCAVYLVFSAEGIARFNGLNQGARIGLPLAMALLAGVGEELIFRGVVFRIAEESFGTVVALGVSAVFFGAVHLSAPHATAVSTAAIALEAGVLLAAAYAATRNLWFPIGLHAAWNFTEGGLFGSAVSGHAVKGLIDAPIHGPPSLTGGSFGPEASPAAVGVCLAAAVILLLIAAARGRWKPMSFRLYPD